MHTSGKKADAGNYNQILPTHHHHQQQQHRNRNPVGAQLKKVHSIKEASKPQHHLDTIVGGSSSLRERRKDLLVIQQQQQYQQTSPSHRSIARSRSNGNVEELRVTLAPSSSENGMKLAASVQSIPTHDVNKPLQTKDGNLEHLAENINNESVPHRKVSLTHIPYSNSLSRRQQPKNEVDEDEAIVKQQINITDEDDPDGEEEDDDEEDDEQENRRIMHTTKPTKLSQRKNSAKMQLQPIPTIAKSSLFLTTTDLKSPTTLVSSPPADDGQQLHETAVQWPASQSPLLQLLRRSSNMDGNRGSRFFPSNFAVDRHLQQQQHHRQQHFNPKSSVGNAIAEYAVANVATPESRRKKLTTTRRADNQVFHFGRLTGAGDNISQHRSNRVPVAAHPGDHSGGDFYESDASADDSGDLKQKPYHHQQVQLKKRLSHVTNQIPPIKPITHNQSFHNRPRRATQHRELQQQQNQHVYTLGLSHHQSRHNQQQHHHSSVKKHSSDPNATVVVQTVVTSASVATPPPKNGMEKYEKLDKIGSGSYGSVYKCQNRDTGEQVAIKKFFETEDDPAIRKIAYREIRVLKQLHHENIVNLMEVFRKKKKLHLVFEYCDTTLLDHMEHVKSELGGVSLQDAKKIMFQVLLALRYIHGHGFIHRDIKPENILLIVPTLTVKLCDFGFARLMNRFNPGEEQFTEYVATRWYRSPELLAGDPYYGPGVDVWAVGCVFPEVVTTQPLFPGQTDTDQLYLIQACLGEYRTPRIKFKSPNEGGTRFPLAERSLELRLKSTLPAKAVRWISRALTLDAGQRPDAETLLRDSFMEDIYKQFEDRWNSQQQQQQQQTSAARTHQQRTLTRVNSGGLMSGAVDAPTSTERSPSRADKLPELPTRTTQQQHQQYQQNSQVLMATSSETLAMAAKLLGTDRLPGINKQ